MKELMKQKKKTKNYYHISFLMKIWSVYTYQKKETLHVHVLPKI